jgi:hypothetical protein
MGMTMRSLAWAVFGIVGLLLGETSPAVASCYSDCLGRCSMIGQTDTAACRSQSAYCSSKCMFGGKDTRAYGAIAYSENDGAFGFSYGHASQDRAQGIAMDECGKNGGGSCRIATWYYNSCGALAKSSNGPWGVGQKDAVRQAQAEAVAYCVRYGGKNCKVVRTTCSR